jgi:predicted acyl esterase
VTGPIEQRLTAITDPLPGAGAGLSVSLLGAEQLLPPYLDTDFVVKLADVDPAGRSTLIQSGFLRASHRRLDPARTRPLRPAPYHDQAHLEPVQAGKPTFYRIEVWPTSKRFAAGHRLRVALYSADTANHFTLLKPVRNTVLAGSSLLLAGPR